MNSGLQGEDCEAMMHFMSPMTHQKTNSKQHLLKGDAPNEVFVPYPTTQQTSREPGGKTGKAFMENLEPFIKAIPRYRFSGWIK